METNLAVMNNLQMNIADTSALVEKWIRFAQVKASSEKAYRKGIKNFLNFLLNSGISSLDDVTKEIMLSYRKFLEVTYKSASTRNLYISSTKLFFIFLEDEGIISKSPAIRLKGFSAKGKHRRDAITPAQNQKVITSLNNAVESVDVSMKKGKKQTLTILRNLALYAVMASTGIRSIEASRAKIKNLDYNEETGTARLFVMGKGRDDDHSEYVILPSPVVTILKTYLSERGNVSDNAPLFASGKKGFHQGNVLPAGHLLPTTISAIVKKLLCSNGINSSRLTCHSLRHGFCTAALNAGATLRQVQLAMHHSSINVTVLYAHELEDEVNPASSLVSAAMGLTA